MRFAVERLSFRSPRVILPSRFELHAVWGDRMYGVVEDELDQQSVGVVTYRLSSPR